MRKVMLWTGLGVAAVSTTLMADNSICAGQIDPLVETPVILAAAGEGGEGSQSQNINADVEFLTDLGLLEGHVVIGMELYQRGDRNAAIQLKLAKDDAYKDLEPALKTRKLSSFAKDLADLIAMVEAIAGAAQRLARHAADEYADGVKDGKIVDVKDYQSAWGFIEAARHTMAGFSVKARKRNRGPIAEIEAEFERLKPVWPDLTGNQPLTADPTLLPAAASRIELAAFSIK
jgi:hypothetical protein